MKQDVVRVGRPIQLAGRIHSTVKRAKNPAPMHIAVLGTRGIPANYGGFETCAEQVVRRWAAWGHQVVVYARRYRYKTRPATVDGAEIRYTGSLRPFGLETPTATLLSVLDLILHRRTHRNVHLYNAANAFLVPLLHLFGFRVVISVDGIEWEREKWGFLHKAAHKLGAKLAVRFADKVVADNEVVAQHYAEQFGCATPMIAYGAQPIARSKDAEEILGRFGLKAGEYCIFVGRFIPDKGVQQLIDAFERLDTRLSLVIVGDDAPTAYRNAVWARQTDKVRLLGYQYGRVYEQLLVNAKMYVSASRLEGTSPSLLSAMAAGVCCLVNGIPENRNTTGGSVALYEQDNSDDLVQTWQALLNDPERLTEVAASGHAHQQRFYDWDVIATEYLELFSDIEQQRAGTLRPGPVIRSPRPRMTRGRS